MSRVMDLAQKLEKLENEYNSVKTELMTALALDKSNKPKVAKKATRKKAAAKVSPTGDATDNPAKEEKRVSLKDVIQGILSKNLDGLDLAGLRAEVDGMVDRKEYISKAKSLSAVISQALNSLKQEDKIQHNRESKKYALSNASA